MISTTYTPIVSPGNGTAAPITVTWPFFSGTLLVTEVASSGVETVKTVTTHYTVSGGTDANGLPATGTVTPVATRAVGTSWRIERVTPLTQGSTWAENDPFPQKTVEAALDRLTLIDQESAAGGADGITGDVMQLNSAGATDYWDGEGHIIRDVAAGTANTDAVNYGQLQDLQLVAGTGDVVGPAASVDGELALYDSTTGKLLKRGTITGLLKAASGVVAQAVAGTDYVAPGGALGTPSSGTLTNATGLPVATGISGLGAGVATFLATPSVSNLNSAVTGGPVKAAGKETIWVPAAAMTARTTNGAAAGTTELATNDVMLRSLDFDTTTEEGAGFWVAMPKSWNESTVTFQALWTAASGSGGVAWGLAAYSFSDDDAMDTAVSGQQIVTDTLLTANDLHITSESSAITIGGTPAAQDAVYFEVTREVANGSDTLGTDAKLLGIRLFITTNAADDT